MFFKKVITLIIIFMALSVAAESPIDQWEDSKKTYKDLINDGFQVKAYDSTSIRTDNNLILILFVTVLQKNKEIYECQEYQTLDGLLNTLDLTFTCRKLTQPFERGLGT
tara:strand:+ start:586 stop:912 length:327 start_codon:yes stop_codon:yes gene_type:complete